MLRSERSRITFVEAHAKREKWRNVALVGVKNTSLVRQFIANFIACKILVVPVWQEDLRPAEAAQQRNAQRNLRVWSKCYTKRFALDDGDPVKAIGRAAREFDAVILWDGIAVADLPRIGAAWAPWVKSGGWLLGVDHRVADVRRILDEVAPAGWEDFREGIWGVRVRRAAEEGIDQLAVAVEDTDTIAEKAGEPVDLEDSIGATVNDDGPALVADDVLAQPSTPSQPGDAVVAHRDDGGAGRDEVRVANATSVAQNRHRIAGNVPRRPPRASGEPPVTPAVGDAQSHVAQPTPKRRGRPPGSKNKAAAC